MGKTRRVPETGPGPAPKLRPVGVPRPGGTGRPDRPPEVVQHGGEWYVHASALSSSLPKLVLKDNDAFLVCDYRGDFPASVPGEFGYYHRGTRFLSTFEMRLQGELLSVLDYGLSTDEHSLTIELTNGNALETGKRSIPRNSIFVRREVGLFHDLLFHRFGFHNFHLEDVDLDVVVKLGADFADIFEIRGLQRSRRGKSLRPAVEKSRLRLSYSGLDGVLRHTEIDAEPVATEAREGYLRFRLPLGSGKDTELTVTVTPGTGDGRQQRSPNAGQPVRPARLLRQVVEERSTMALPLPVFRTEHEGMTRILNRAVRDIGLMLSHHEDGVYPYAGIPWYTAPFGRDGAITALFCLPWMPEVARGTLLFQARHQATDFDDFTDREPGKIFHELREGEMAALREIPFIPYYGSVDSTPLFVILLDEYMRATNDLDLLERLWTHLLAAVQWMEKHGDLDGDGFLEYRCRSPQGLRNQGWKDSFDAICHRDGRLAEPPIALCEIQGYAVLAYEGAARLALRRGDGEELQERWRARARALREAIASTFWIDRQDCYALALDGAKEPCTPVTSNAGYLLWAGIPDEERAGRLARRLLADDMFTGYGVRTLSSREERYNPLSYHNGSVWPHDNAFVAAGLRRYGHREEALRVITGMFQAIEHLPDGRVPEVFCGFQRSDHGKPTVYPVACAPQALASGAVLQMVSTLLGLQINGDGKTVWFQDPVLPEWLGWLEVRGLPVPGGTMDFTAFRGRLACSMEVMDKPPALEVYVRK